MLARAVHDRNIIVDVMTHTDSVRGMKLKNSAVSTPYMKINGNNKARNEEKQTHLAYDGIIKSKAKHIASEPTAIRKARIGDLFGN